MDWESSYMDRWIMGIVVGVLLTCVAYLLYDVKQLKEQVEYLNDHEHVIDGQYEYQQSINKHDDINRVFDGFLNLVIELKKLENSELPDVILEDK
jgi:signal transduction histidine kinase